MREKIIKIAEILTPASYLGIIFLIPLYFAVFFRTNDVFELNKLILFKILVLLFFCFSLTKFIFKIADKRGFSSVKDFIRERFKENWKYLIAPALFIIFFLFSTFISPDPAVSFFGKDSRWQGALTQLYYFFFFLLLILTVKSSREIKRIVFTVCLSSFFVSLYGLAQLAGFDFLPWNEPPFLTGRASSSLGQPNFLASYLLLVIPFSFYFFFSSRFWPRFLSFLLLIFQIAALILTYSRGGWLGLAAAGCFSLFLFWLSGPGRIFFKAHRLKIGLAIFIFLAGTVSAFFLFPESFFFRRLKSMTDFRNGSNVVRLATWQSGWEAFKERPWRGYGPENQSGAFYRFYRRDWASHEAINSYPDRGHNIILDVLLTRGLFGLVFYLFLLFSFFRLGWENIKKKYCPLLSGIILSAVFGYLISLLFSFEVVTSGVYFWLCLALVFLLNKIGEGKSVPAEKQEKIKIKRAIYFLPLLVFLAAFFLARQEINNLISDHYFYYFLESHFSGENQSSLILARDIKEANPRPDYYSSQIASYLADSFGNLSEEQKRESALILREVLAKIKEKNENYLIKGKIYGALSLSEEKEKNSWLARENFLKAIAASPEMPKNYRAFATFLKEEGDFAASREYYEKALSLVPWGESGILAERQNFLMRIENYLIYLGLGDLFFQEEKWAEARGYYEQAYKMNPDDLSVFLKISDTFYLSGDEKKAIWYNERGMERRPADFRFPLAIAIMRKQKGESALAEEYLKKALELAPDSREIKEFIDSLK